MLGAVARKQVLVQLDDGLVAELDRWADKEGVSRSELLRRAAVALIAAYDEAEEDRRTVEAYRRMPQDPVMTETLNRLAAEHAPPW